MIATALALPITVILAFVLTAHGRGGTAHPASSSPGPLPAVPVAAPPSPSTAVQAACVKVFAKLPVQLGQLAPRRTDTDSSFVAAWGQPPTVVRCGVAKPAIYGTAQAAQLIDVNSVIWQPDPQKAQTVFTAVDRGVYVEVTVPAGADLPLTLLATAVQALPATCTATDAAGNVSAKLPICRG
ncbi:MAG: DUF3515 family protein [Jatrophihabitantaceae bacterium]